MTGAVGDKETWRKGDRGIGRETEDRAIQSSEFCGR
jgi:hypothetical protein